MADLVIFPTLVPRASKALPTIDLGRAQAAFWARKRLDADISEHVLKKFDREPGGGTPSPAYLEAASIIANIADYADADIAKAARVIIDGAGAALNIRMRAVNALIAVKKRNADQTK